MHDSFLNFDHWESVWFEHSAPADPALLADYQKVFNCEVLFDQPASGIRIRESMLDDVLPQANAELLDMLLAHATKLMAELDQSQRTADQVKNILRLMLNQQPPSSEMIAEKLGISSRTLQRKLSEEGTHYKDVLNELRYELAVYFLKTPNLLWIISPTNWAMRRHVRFIAASSSGLERLQELIAQPILHAQ